MLVNPPWKLLVGIGILALIIILVFYVMRAGEEKGKLEERDQANEIVFEKLEKANEVQKTFPSNDRALYEQCLRSARSSENCKRFLPVGESE